MLECMIKSPNANLKIQLPFTFFTLLAVESLSCEWIFIILFLQFHWYAQMCEAAAVIVIFSVVLIKDWLYGIQYSEKKELQRCSLLCSNNSFNQKFICLRSASCLKSHDFIVFFSLQCLVKMLDWMCHHRRDLALLLPGVLLLDVSRRGPAVPYACGGLWKRILPEKVLLRVWLPFSCCRGRRLHCYWLQELWDRKSVSAGFMSKSLNT